VRFNSVDQIYFNFLLGACHWFTLGLRYESNAPEFLKGAEI
jgi:hypothetical protein